MRKKSRVISVLSVLLLLAFASADAGPSGKSANGNEDQAHAKKVVYVCACLKNKSCSCMTEAKMEGPCACGTEGGPPMKEVPADSDWAKQNRDALAR